MDPVAKVAVYGFHANAVPHRRTKSLEVSLSFVEGVVRKGGTHRDAEAVFT